MPDNPPDESTALAPFEEAVRTLRESGNQVDPRNIVAYVFDHPFTLDAALNIPAVISASKRGGMQIELPAGVGVMNKVTPEQLLAIVASLIATSKDATQACVRIRQEVLSWKFQGADGKVE